MDDATPTAPDASAFPLRRRDFLRNAAGIALVSALAPASTQAATKAVPHVPTFFTAAE